MKTKTTKLRALPTVEVAKRYKRAIANNNLTAKWRYFFELAVRAMDAQFSLP